MRHRLLPLVLAVAPSLPGCRPRDVRPRDSGPPPDSGEPADSDVPDGGPTAVARSDPAAGTVPLAVTLSGADSLAGDVPIERYEWRFPDGSVVGGETVQTTLVAEGTHGFTLTVVDEGGRSAEDGVQVEASCPAFDDAVVAGVMSWGEVSGLAAASTPGYLWGHSDAQGDGPEVFAISTSATLRGTFTLSGISDTDWEDIARGPGPVEGLSYLYVADTGDNAESRRSVTVLRFEEPTQLDGGTIADVESFEFTYPGGARDAETLLVDPVSGDLLIVERDRDDEGVSGVFLAQAPLDGSGTTELTEVGTLRFGVDPLPGDIDATAGDVSADGRLVAVRTHDRVWIFARDPAQPIQTAFSNPVCGAPLVDEPKGEALAFALDGSGYTTGGEGVGEVLHWFGAR